MPFNGGTKMKDGRVIENHFTSGKSSHDGQINTPARPEYRIKKPNGGGYEYTRDIKAKDVAGH